MQPGPTLHCLPQALWRGAWPLGTSVYLSVKWRGLPSEGVPILAFLRGYQRSEGSPPLPSSVRTGLGEEGCLEVPVAREPLGPQGLPWSFTLALSAAPHCCVCWCPQGKQDQWGGPGTVQGGLCRGQQWGLSAPGGGLHGVPSGVHPSTRPGRTVISGPPVLPQVPGQHLPAPRGGEVQEDQAAEPSVPGEAACSGVWPGQVHACAHHAHACMRTPYTSTHSCTHTRMQAPALRRTCLRTHTTHAHTHAHTRTRMVPLGGVGEAAGTRGWRAGAGMAGQGGQQGAAGDPGLREHGSCITSLCCVFSPPPRRVSTSFECVGMPWALGRFLP